MSSYDLSVIIPAYNKASVLLETLGALKQQTLSLDAFEVIVVDDGSSDGVLEIVRSQEFPFTLHLLRQSNKGAGAARNLGAGSSAGRILLFLDADIITSESLLCEHLEAHHRADRVLVMGRVQPWPASGSSPAHRVFDESFDLGTQERIVPYTLGITQNLSIKRRHFAAVGSFDESLPRGQDIEFAYRAICDGFDLWYFPLALAYHNHALTLSQLCDKVRCDHGKLAPMFQKCPACAKDLNYLQDKWPIAWGEDALDLIGRKVARRLEALPPVRIGMRLACQALERVWPSPGLLQSLVWRTLAGYQWVGLREGMKRYDWES